MVRKGFYYSEKYGKAYQEDRFHTLLDIAKEFDDDFRRECCTFDIMTISSFDLMLRKYNTLWNTLVGVFQLDFGVDDVLRRDHFINAWKQWGSEEATKLLEEIRGLHR